MLFLSTYQNKVDKKGRVSVPAPFRAALGKVALKGEEFSGIIAYGSFINRCIEACGIDRIRKLSGRIELLDPFSEERDAFATTILGGSQQLPFDGEGRVMLPEPLIELAGLADMAIFVGKGETFEIWEPRAFDGICCPRPRTCAREAPAPARRGRRAMNHTPVMLREVLAAMRPADGEVYVDGTFGAGGYSRALLEAAQCTVYAIDRDPGVAALAEKLAEAFPNRFFWLMGSFSNMIDRLAAKGVTSVDGIVLDIGVSSMQIDHPERGFSFRNDGPLDMRMSSSGQSAADIINTADEEEISDILYHYGEERKSRRIARAIVKARTESAHCAHQRACGHYPPRGQRRQDIDPSTRTFQALRIKVNEELGELERGACQPRSACLHLREGWWSSPSIRLRIASSNNFFSRVLAKLGEVRVICRKLGQPKWRPLTTSPLFFSRRRKPVVARKMKSAPIRAARSAKLRVCHPHGEGRMTLRLVVLWMFLWRGCRLRPLHGEIQSAGD